MTAYLLDTTVLVDYSHGDPAGVAVMERVFAESYSLFTCDVVTCESLSGGSAEQRAAIHQLWTRLSTWHWRLRTLDGQAISVERASNPDSASRARPMR